MMWATGPLLVVLFVCLFLTPTHIFYYLTSGWWRLNWVKMLKKQTKKQLQQLIKYPTDITYSPTERSLTEIWRFATSAYTHLGHINYPAFQHIFIAPGVALAAAEECGPGQRARIVFPYETEATRVFIFFFLPSSAPLCSSGVILAISCDKVKSRSGGAPLCTAGTWPRIYNPTLRSTSGRGGQGDGAGVQARGGAGGSACAKTTPCVKVCVEAAVELGSGICARRV